MARVAAIMYANVVMGFYLTKKETLVTVSFVNAYFCALVCYYASLVFASLIFVHFLFDITLS